MAAAAAAMTADAGQSQVVSFDPTSPAAAAARGAYPLTMPVYAAVNPKASDADLRRSYAAFIRFAATDGQQSGTAIGQLPQGFLPLPDAWRDLATAAADDIEAGRMPTAGGGGTTTPASPGTPVAGIPFPSGGVVGSAPAAAAPAGGSAPAATAADPSATGTAAAARAGATTPDDPDLGALPPPSPSASRAVSPPPSPSPCSAACVDVSDGARRHPTTCPLPTEHPNPITASHIERH